MYMAKSHAHYVKTYNYLRHVCATSELSMRAMRAISKPARRNAELKLAAAACGMKWHRRDIAALVCKNRERNQK